MSLKDKTYEILKDRIINCVYPPGTMLKEREIIEELGISRTPFREAATALMYEDLVRLIPYQGIVVTEITLKDIENLYAVREKLELYALTLCMEAIPQAALQSCYESISGNLGTEERAEALRQDEDVHALILRYADNKLLKRLMDGLYDQMHRVRVLSTAQESAVACTREEHLEILRSMLEGDVNKASSALQKHIHGSKERALGVLLNNNDKLYFRF